MAGQVAPGRATASSSARLLSGGAGAQPCSTTAAALVRGLQGSEKGVCRLAGGPVFAAVLRMSSAHVRHPAVVVKPRAPGSPLHDSLPPLL